MVANHHIITYNAEYCEGRFYLLDGKSVDVVKASKKDIAHSEAFNG